MAIVVWNGDDADDDADDDSDDDSDDDYSGVEISLWPSSLLLPY
jgi:hypothetical protein